MGEFVPFPKSFFFQFDVVLSQESVDASSGGSRISRWWWEAAFGENVWKNGRIGSRWVGGAAWSATGKNFVFRSVFTKILMICCEDPGPRFLPCKLQMLLPHNEFQWHSDYIFYTSQGRIQDLFGGGGADRDCYSTTPPTVYRCNEYRHDSFMQKL